LQCAAVTRPYIRFKTAWAFVFSPSSNASLVSNVTKHLLQTWLLNIFINFFLANWAASFQ